MNIDDFDDFIGSTPNQVVPLASSVITVPDLNTSKMDIHLRIQQRNGRKSWTIIENIERINKDNDADFIKKISKVFRDKFHCGVSIKENNILQLQGDHRNDIYEFLIKGKHAKKDNIKIHGA